MDVLRFIAHIFSDGGKERDDVVINFTIDFMNAFHIDVYKRQDVITSPMISVISGVIMDAGIWCRMVKSALAPMEAAAFPAAARSF